MGDPKPPSMHLDPRVEQASAQRSRAPSPVGNVLPESPPPHDGDSDSDGDCPDFRQTSPPDFDPNAYSEHHHDDSPMVETSSSSSSSGSSWEEEVQEEEEPMPRFELPPRTADPMDDYTWRFMKTGRVKVLPVIYESIFEGSDDDGDSMTGDKVARKQAAEVSKTQFRTKETALERYRRMKNEKLANAHYRCGEDSASGEVLQSDLAGDPQNPQEVPTGNGEDVGRSPEEHVRRMSMDGCLMRKGADDFGLFTDISPEDSPQSDETDTEREDHTALEACRSLAEATGDEKGLGVWPQELPRTFSVVPTLRRTSGNRFSMLASLTVMATTDKDGRPLDNNVDPVAIYNAARKPRYDTGPVVPEVPRRRRRSNAVSSDFQLLTEGLSELAIADGSADHSSERRHSNDAQSLVLRDPNLIASDQTAPGGSTDPMDRPAAKSTSGSDVQQQCGGGQIPGSVASQGTVDRRAAPAGRRSATSTPQSPREGMNSTTPPRRNPQGGETLLASEQPPSRRAASTSAVIQTPKSEILSSPEFFEVRAARFMQRAEELRQFRADLETHNAEMARTPPGRLPLTKSFGRIPGVGQGTNVATRSVPGPSRMPQEELQQVMRKRQERRLSCGHGSDGEEQKKSIAGDNHKREKTGVADDHQDEKKENSRRGGRVTSGGRDITEGDYHYDKKQSSLRGGLTMNPSMEENDEFHYSLKGQTTRRGDRIASRERQDTGGAHQYQKKPSSLGRGGTTSKKSDDGQDYDYNLKGATTLGGERIANRETQAAGRAHHYQKKLYFRGGAGTTSKETQDSQHYHYYHTRESSLRGEQITSREPEEIEEEYHYGKNESSVRGGSIGSSEKEDSDRNDYYKKKATFMRRVAGREKHDNDDGLDHHNKNTTLYRDRIISTDRKEKDAHDCDKQKETCRSGGQPTHRARDDHDDDDCEPKTPQSSNQGSALI